MRFLIYLCLPVLLGFLLFLPQRVIGQCGADVSAGPDQFGCTTPTFAVLDGSINGPYVSFAWTPTAGMVGANTLTPSVTVSQPTQYVLRVRTVNTAQNLIENGDFEQGLTGFTSEYVHNPGFLFFPWGTYDVVNLSPYSMCNDNSGSGNLLAVDGADVPNLTVWCQTVNVTPNTDYQLSAWIANIGGCSPLASIEFNINGTVVGIGTVPSAACVWSNFSGIWNSGNNSSATICLEDIVVTGSCNDFGIDDIGLYPICNITDTVLVQPVNVLAVANPNVAFIPCEGAPITLNGNGSSSGPQVSYLWETFGGNIVSGATTLQPTIDASGVYTLNVTYDYGSGECTRSTDVQVTPTPNPLSVFMTPPLPLGCPGAPVNLSAVANQGAVSYSWSTPDGNIVSGANTSNPTVNAIGTYEVLVTNLINGCTATASVSTTLSNNPLLASIAPPSPIGCGGNTVTLTGSANQGSVSYSWSTPNGNIVAGQNTSSPVVDSVGVYVLQVTNIGSGCTDTAQTTVGSAANPPLATAAATGMITCVQDTVRLSGAGSSSGNNITYAWSSPNGLFLAPQDTLETAVGAVGLYVLAVTNTTNNCTSLDTITVAGDTLPPLISLAPNAPLTCKVDTLTLQADVTPSGAQLVWIALNGGVISSGDTTANPQVIAAGQYQLTALNVANGCSAQAIDTVLENRIPPTAQAQSPDTLDCVTSAVSLASTGSSTGNAIRYEWTGGNILSGANGPVPIVNVPEWYTLLVTDTLNGCTATASVLTIADTTPVVAVASAPDTLTCGVLSVPLGAAGSSILPGLQYAWSTLDGQILSGANTDTPIVNAPGTYTLMLTNPANGCSATDNTVVEENVVAPGAQIAAPVLITCTTANQTLNLFNPMPANAALAWTAGNGGNIVSGASSASPLIDAPGLYTVLITNPANACTATESVSVSIDTTAPAASAAAPGPITCANTQITLSSAGSATGSGITYAWSATNGGQIVSGANTPAPVISAAGNYQLVVSSAANGCSSAATVSATTDLQPPVFQILPVDSLTCVKLRDTLALDNPVAGFVYQWQTPNGLLVSGQNTPSPVVGAPGTYMVSVTNPANGCDATDSISVFTDSNVPAAAIDAPDTLTCGATSVVLPGSGSSGTNYQYAWAGPGLVSGQNTLNPVVNSPGTYQLTVDNTANGCSALAAVQVVENKTSPIASIAPPGTLTCNTVSLILSAQPAGNAYAFAWTAGNGGNIASGTGNASPLIDAPGLYTVVITDLANNCTATESVSVSIDTTAPAAAAAAPGPITCKNTQITLSSAGSATGSGITYAWAAANGGQIVSGANTPAPVINAAGNYQLVVSNAANGCSSATTVLATTDLQAPVFQILPADSLTCIKLRDTLTLDNPVASFAYQWQTLNGVLVSGQNTPSPVVGAAGTYTVNVTNPANGCNATDSIQVFTDSNVPAAGIGAPDTLTCSATSVVLPGNGSIGAKFQYSWAGPGLVSGQNTLNPAVNLPGAYQLTVGNTANGCSAQATVQVAENKTAPNASVAPPGTLTCNTTSLGLSAQPAGNGYAYAWTSSIGGNIASGASSATPVVDAPGVYTLTVTSQQNGCSGTAVATVAADVITPTFTLDNPAPLTCSLQQIALSADVLQPASGFVVQWSTANGHFTGGQNTLNPGVDEPGTYTLTVQNQQNGCSSTDTLLVVQNTIPPMASAGEADTLTCVIKQVQLDGNGSSTGAQMQYKWSGPGIVSGVTSLTALAAAAGWYVLSVTDQSNGCRAADSVQVVIDTLRPLATIAPPATLTCALNALALNAIGSSIGPAFNLQWSGSGIVSGGNGLMPVVAQAGAYTLLVRNLQNGCTSSAQVQVQQHLTAPTADAGKPGLLHCNKTQTTLSGSGTPTGLTYAWSAAAGSGGLVSGANTPTPSVGAPGVYTLTVTRLDNGCSDTDSVLVNQAPEPAFVPTAEQPDCLNPFGRIDIAAEPEAVKPLGYSINGGLTFQTTPVFYPLEPGMYTLILRDAYGCTAAEAVELDPPAYPEVLLPPTYTMPLGDSVFLTPTTVPPASGIASWTWTPALDLSCADCPEPSAKPLLTRQYRLSITDLNGCTAEATTRVLVDRGRKVYAPNIFSPDDDGRDDRFILYAKAALDIESIQVYDRWGSLVWQGTHLTPGDESAGWDGRVRGELSSPAVYVWQARIRFLDGQTELFEGDVTVVR